MFPKEGTTDSKTKSHTGESSGLDKFITFKFEDLVIISSLGLAWRLRVAGIAIVPEVCKDCIQAGVICSVTSMRRLRKADPIRGTHSLTVSLPPEGISLVTGEASTHPVNTQQHVADPCCWQLNEIKLLLFKRSAGWMSEAAQDKVSFSRTMDHRFNISVEVSPPMSIHNLSHLKCTVVGEEMQKQQMGFARSHMRDL